MQPFCAPWVRSWRVNWRVSMLAMATVPLRQVVAERGSAAEVEATRGRSR